MTKKENVTVQAIKIMFVFLAVSFFLYNALPVLFKTLEGDVLGSWSVGIGFITALFLTDKILGWIKV